MENHENLFSGEPFGITCVLDLIWEEEADPVAFPSLTHLIILPETQDQNK